jgi:hypothetical protein
MMRSVPTHDERIPARAAKREGNEVRNSQSSRARPSEPRQTVRQKVKEQRPQRHDADERADDADDVEDEVLPLALGDDASEVAQG